MVLITTAAGNSLTHLCKAKSQGMQKPGDHGSHTQGEQRLEKTELPAAALRGFGWREEQGPEGHGPQPGPGATFPATTLLCDLESVDLGFLPC